MSYGKGKRRATQRSLIKSIQRKSKFLMTHYGAPASINGCVVTAVLSKLVITGFPELPAVNLQIASCTVLLSA